MAMTTLPTPPSRNAGSSVFATQADALLSALPQFVTDANALQVDVLSKQVSSTSSATAAQTSALNSEASNQAAIAVSSASLWVSGTTYAIGNVRYSPINFTSYRRKTAGTGTTDPSLDITNWGAVAAAALGIGGSVSSGNVTLTNLSPGAQFITPATPGLYITLPDATTIQSQGIGLFSIYNNGDFDLGVKNFAGLQLGWVRPGSDSLIGLADKSTSAGSWNCTSLEKTAVTAQYYTSANPGTSVIAYRVVLDANRTFILTFGSASTYGVVYDASTNTWGAATLIRATGDFLAQCLSATNQVLICFMGALLTVSVAGTSITVNAATTVSIVGTSIGPTGTSIIAVGAAFLLQYFTGSSSVATCYCNSLVVSGTTVSMSPTTTMYNGNANFYSVVPLGYVVSSNSVLAVTSNAATIFAQVIVVSGVTAPNAAGTVYTGISAAVTHKVIPLSSGRFFVCGSAASTGQVAILSVSGATITGSFATFSSNLSTYDALLVSPSKLLLVSFVGSTSFSAVLVTDTAGTISIGTPVTYNNPQASSIAAGIMVGTSAIIQVGSQFVYTLDCSGAIPAVVNYQNFQTGLPAGNPVPIGATGSDNTKAIANIVSGNSLIVLNISGQLIQKINTTSVKIINQVALGLGYNVNLFQGSALNDAWTLGKNTSATSSIGFTLSRIEGAA